MKVKILNATLKSYWYSGKIGEEFDVDYYNICDRENSYKQSGMPRYFRNHDVVITELPDTFCVNICDDKDKWWKYIKWLNKTYKWGFTGNVWKYYGYSIVSGTNAIDKPFGIEIHIDDMIKHIDYMEQHIKGGEQFHKESQLTVKMDKKEINKYIEDNFKGGTIFIGFDGNKYIIPDEHDFAYVSYEYLDVIKLKVRLYHKDCKCETSMVDVWRLDKGFVEIIKEEINMETQKLSRQGLKEIHSIACSQWKGKLEGMGIRNPLEDYIELSHEEVNEMFDACTKEQLPIVSKYLKQDDGSVDLTNVMYNNSGVIFKLGTEDEKYILRHNDSDSDNKSFWLNPSFSWVIKVVHGVPRLYPTKKK